MSLCILILTLNTVLRNPLYFMMLLLLGVGGYITYTLNLWGPMLRMANAASSQGLEVFKERLREFLESSDTGRQAMAMSGTKPETFGLEPLSREGKKIDTSATAGEDDEEI